MHVGLVPVGQGIIFPLEHAFVPGPPLELEEELLAQQVIVNSPDSIQLSEQLEQLELL